MRPAALIRNAVAALTLVGAAASAATAAAERHRPRAADLRRLGIDPAQFDAIGR